MVTHPWLPAAAVLTGHVDRLAEFREFLDDVRDVDGLPGPAIRGRHLGRELVVIGTGMGGTVTVRAASALIAGGCSVLVRAGGAGPIATDVSSGDFVIATAAVRDEGASDAFLEPGMPAVADLGVVAALATAMKDEGVPGRVGVVHSKDSFFGVFDPESSPREPRIRARMESWRRLGVLASEMEAAALFATASAFGVRAGAVLRVNDVRRDSGAHTATQLAMCRAASTAAVISVRSEED